MEILIFVLVISNLNLVLSEDNLAIKKSITSEDSYKVHPDQENQDFPNDQLAESSQTVTHSYENGVINGNHREFQENKNLVQNSEKLTNSDVEPHVLRQSFLTLNPIQVVQHGSHQKYDEQQQTHQLYLQQYPTQQVQIFNAEASPLQQTDPNKNTQIIGAGMSNQRYSSYIEHSSAKDEDDVQSALQDGSVSDIKRLVPKSGISFTIYQNGKNTETQNSGAQLNQLSHYSSSLQHKVRGESPATHLRVQNEVHQTPSVEELQLGNSQYSHLEEHASGSAQQLLQPPAQNQQSRNAQAIYYTQPETHKTFARVTEKSPFVKSQFKINLAESNHNEQTAAAEFHQNIKSSSKSSKQNFLDVENQKYLNIKDEVGGFQKAVKPAKNFEAVHYGTDPLYHTQGNKRVTYTQTHGGGGGSHYYGTPKKENSFIETLQKDSGKYLSNSFSAKAANNVAGQLPQFDKKLVLNRLSGNYITTEELKPGHVVSHLGITAYADNAFKSDHFAAPDSETAKSSQQGLINHVPSSPYLETKNSQTFDHQKALEGSTSFDIKNAIDGSGASLHETNYPSPSVTEIHSGENLQKQQLTYILPKIPTTAVVIDNGVHEPVAGGHQFKDFGHAGISAQLLYHNEPQIAGKFFYPPQTLQWTSGIKQGAPTYAKDSHHQILKLHLPKEEVFVKTPHVEFPTSVISHVSHSQQKQPFVLHYELPFVKSPQEIHLQPNTKTRFPTIQANQFKLTGQPVALDWSLFKSGVPNFGINSLSVKPEISSHIQESGKKIVPILIRKRKNRSHTKQEGGVIYGKVTASRRPTKPNHRQEKNIRVNLLPEASNNVQQFETKGERKNEFSVSASYKVDRSLSS